MRSTKFVLIECKLEEMWQQKTRHCLLPLTKSVSKSSFFIVFFFLQNRHLKDYLQTLNLYTNYVYIFKLALKCLWSQNVVTRSNRALHPRKLCKRMRGDWKIWFWAIIQVDNISLILMSTYFCSATKIKLGLNMKGWLLMYNQKY